MAREKKKNRLKAAVLIMICILFVLLILLVMTLGRSSGKEWSLGDGESINGPEEKVQGANGWYFMYSEETGTKGKIDVSKLKECVWSNKGSCWFYYGVEGMWMPEEFAADGYDPDKEKNWWLFDLDGHMNNAGKKGYTTAVAWEAPSGGEYRIDIDYEAGTSSYEWEEKIYYISRKEGGDGLYLTLNIAGKDVDKKFCKLVTKKDPELSKGTISETVKLSKGDRIYLCSDPGDSPNCDTVRYKAHITQEKGGFDFSFEFGENLVLILVSAAALIGGFAISWFGKRQ